MKILLAEDEFQIAQSLRKNLDSEGIDVTLVRDGDEALKSLNSERFDVVLLDWRMPKLSGIEVCRQMRNRGDKTPVILLTALSDISNKLEAFQLGADDYVIKPYVFDEVLARIHAVVRRSQSETTISIGNIEIDLISRTLFGKNCKLSLTDQEVDLLRYFSQNKNTIINKEQLATNVWKLNYYPTTNIIEAAIKNLRKKLEEVCDTKYIKTIYGEGYIFIEE